MDAKLVTASILLAALMVTSGLAVYFASQMDETTSDATGDSNDGSGTQIEPANRAPSLYVAEANFGYGNPVIISGWVVDESFNTTAVSVQIFSEDSLSEPVLSEQVTADERGVWSITLPYDEPGNWLAEVMATDAQGLNSTSEMVSVTLSPPDEQVVSLTIQYINAEEKSTNGLLVGDLIHLFPATCSVEFWPEGQSEIEGAVNVINATFAIIVDESEVAHNGVLWAICGLFDVQAANFSYQLPIVDAVPEDQITDSDSDGIVDADDDCQNTPDDEPVWPNGCSPSQLDTDEDGVTDDLDYCPDTAIGLNIDANGCAENQKDADSDGISDASDQCPNTPTNEVADANGCSDSQKDQDGDGVQDSLDNCPNTLAGTTVDASGCPVVEYDKTDSWLCQGSGVGPVYDLNPQYGYQSNSNSPFTCQLTVTVGSTFMRVSTNGIPNHDFVSTRGCCTDEVSYDFDIPLNPVNDTDGTYELVSDRGQIAVAINGVPIYGPEDGPGGDAVALHHKYYTENRQQIDLGICGGHSARDYYHYHWDANCVLWTPGAGEDMTDYDWTEIDSSQHSGIIGWSFDGYPIYGMYGWDDSQNVVQITSSYQLKASGNDGYSGTDDWEYVRGMGDLDQCNGVWGPTPEFPDGIYHYVSTPLSGSANTHVDTDGTTVDMIGFPYFQMCYRGDATGGPKGGGGQGQGPGPGGAIIQFIPYFLLPEDGMSSARVLGFPAPIIGSILFGISLIAIIYVIYIRKNKGSM